jgi:hypothetical protein
MLTTIRRRIFCLHVTGEWRKICNEELQDLNSPNIIPVIKSRRMGWEGHVARIGREEMHAGFSWGNLK